MRQSEILLGRLWNELQEEVLTPWVGCQTAWRLSRGPGAHYPAQPLGVPGWLQMAATPAHNGIASHGRRPVSWSLFGDDLIFSKGVFWIWLAGFCRVLKFHFFLLILFSMEMQVRYSLKRFFTKPEHCAQCWAPHHKTLRCWSVSREGRWSWWRV